MLNIKEAKEYLRIDDSYTEEDSYLNDLLVVAESYVRDAITDYESKIKNSAFVQKAKMVERYILQNVYDERYAVGDNNTKHNFTYPVQSMLRQMEYGEYPEDEIEVVSDV